MSIIRSDGSIESSNIPGFETSNQTVDNTIYRCMITRVRYVDDIVNVNLTNGTSNPQVTYDAIIIGGENEGRILTHLRDTTNGLGGDINYSERVLKAASKPIELSKGTPMSQNDGDIVYVAFINGDPLVPIIIGNGTQFLDRDQTGAKKEESPRYNWEYNGIQHFISNEGEYTIIRKGGILDEISSTFTPGEGKASLISLDKKGSIFLMSNDGSYISLNADKGEMSLTQKDGNMIGLTSDEITLSHKTGKSMINITEDAVQVTSDSDMKLQANTYAVNAGSITMSIAEGTGKVAIGNGVAEVLDLINQILGALDTLITGMQTEIHTGNLGFPTSPPLNAAVYASVKIQLTLVKTLLGLIKGSV